MSSVMLVRQGVRWTRFVPSARPASVSITARIVMGTAAAPSAVWTVAAIAAWTGVWKGKCIMDNRIEIDIFAYRLLRGSFLK